MMNFQVIIEKTSEDGVEQFWRATEIYIKNPHLVNRRISSCVGLLVAELECSELYLLDTLLRMSKTENSINFYDNSENIKKLLTSNNTCTFLAQTFDPLKTESKSRYLLVNRYLPRDSSKFSSGVQFIIIDKKTKSILQFHHNLDHEKRFLDLNKPYKITFSDEGKFSISVQDSEFDSSDSSVIWLRDKLFPCLLKWMKQKPLNEDALVSGSLNLVSSHEYSILYDRLKKKYGQEMVKKWTECTDPNKFVYEDVAIATYLILLWESERKGNDEKKQSFVDLGCGNGLLVHILSSEGYTGVGIDLRKRQIWDIYPLETHLVERAIVPSSSSLFPEADWLIGNHSDELTPWIPVIAARSSYHCRFFLLPCCAHEFDGRKFQRASAAKSQYSEYLRYIKSVSEACGFKTDLDRLKIPSTKRICLIGRERTYSREKFCTQDKIIQKIIEERSLKSRQASTDTENSTDKKMDRNLESKWSEDFQPRACVERVRNCTKLDRSVIKEVVEIVAAQLLLKVRNITRENEEGIWNAGGQIELSEIAKILSSDMLKEMKNECGGLQTLLKNNAHIFQVMQGKVQFRVPGNNSESGKKGKSKKNQRLKTKPCWFNENHPDGCFVSDEKCCFRHDPAPGKDLNK